MFSFRLFTKISNQAFIITWSAFNGTKGGKLSEIYKILLANYKSTWPTFQFKKEIGECIADLESSTTTWLFSNEESNDHAALKSPRPQLVDITLAKVIWKWED